jgi:cytochrome c oxidase cbb3-type subunit 2
MPAYPWYFRLKDEAEGSDVVVPVPAQFVPPGKIVAASAEALALVRYLQSLMQPEVPKE